MKIRHIIQAIAALALVGCTADDAQWQLAPEQQELIGQGVNFSATMAQPFITRSVTYHHDGSFNEGDQMRIFRQYANDNDVTTFDAAGEIFRTYYLKMDYATGTSLSLGSDWLPKAGKLKSDKIGETAMQTAADSLTWENGRTVRFRAWSRSNLAGRLDAGTRESFYPDFTVSDWVTVSGPTKNIPLTMRHIACRVGITAKAGNELSHAEICTDAADYDNEQDAAQVLAAYQKMCMPAGVDDQTFLLTTMTQARYNDAGTDFKNLEKYGTADGIVTIGTKTASEIASTVQRPLFNSNDGRLYLMSIPFDMSSEGEGQTIVLPACTRIKVWLYDVNNGDRHDTTGSTGTELKCHIFQLSDIKDEQGNPVFQQGLTLRPGYSYLFSVGYHYNALTITASGSFAWEEQDLGNADANNKAQAQDQLDFSWWTKAYTDAAKTALGGGDFVPVFSIDNQAQFLTFIKLVNGTAATRMSGLTRGDLRDKDENGFDTYWWLPDGETDPITREEAEQRGYVFYPHFYPSVSTQAAHVIEDYVQGPMDFYDTDFGTRYEVNLTQDINLYDWQLPSIGENTEKPFRGHFKGNGHTLSNLNMQSGCLFAHVMDGAITNLRIESTHAVDLLNEATASGKLGWGCYIAGIAMQCPSSQNAIARSLHATSSVVGCIHVGDATGALVGSATNLTMMGCMQAAVGIPSGAGALLGSGSVVGTSFKYNYYDVQLSPGTVAVGGSAATYDYDQYVRGAKSHVLKAKNDYLISDEVDKNKLSATQLSEMYGLAPWKAMNLGIEAYNSTKIGGQYPCQMKYEMPSEGFANRYPVLKD